MYVYDDNVVLYGAVVLYGGRSHVVTNKWKSGVWYPSIRKMNVKSVQNLPID